MGNPAWNYKVVTELNEMTYQIEKYAHRRNVILGITKAYYNIVKTRPSNVNCGNINAIAMEPTHA